MNDTNEPFAGNVFGRKDPHDTLQAFRSGTVNLEDFGPGMFAKYQDRMQHSVDADIIHKLAVADGFIIGVIFGLRRAHLAGV